MSAQTCRWWRRKCPVLLTALSSCPQTAAGCSTRLPFQQSRGGSGAGTTPQPGVAAGAAPEVVYLGKIFVTLEGATNR